MFPTLDTIIANGTSNNATKVISVGPSYATYIVETMARQVEIYHRSFYLPVLVLPTIVSLSWLLTKTTSQTWVPKVHEAKDPQAPQPARNYPHWDPIKGLDLLAVLTRALLSSSFLQTALDTIKRYGGSKYTMAYSFIGQPVIVTLQPENIKALLSPKFRDYTHGEDRLNTLRPLLGNGIFNSNGDAWKASPPIDFMQLFNAKVFADY
jgi:hypothetical protein